MGVWAKISKVTIVLHLKVTPSQETIANRNAVNKIRENKLTKLGTGKMPSLAVSASRVLSDTGQVTH